MYLNSFHINYLQLDEKNNKTYSQDLRQSSKSEEKAQAITKRNKTMNK